MDTQLIVSSLEKLAGKLGTTAEYLWPKLVAQAKASAIITMLSFFFAAIVCSVIIPLLYKVIKSNRSKIEVYDIADNYAMCSFFSYLGILLAVVLGTLFLCQGLYQIPIIQFPEATAIQHVINGIK